MYADQGRISGLTLGDLMDEAVSSAVKWGSSFDDRNTLNDWASYICQYAADATKIGLSKDEQYKKLIKAANLALYAATRVRGDTQYGKVAPRHYDA